MKNVVYTMIQHVKGRKGQGMAEYALIIGLVAICLVLALSSIPDPIAKILAVVAETLGIPQ